MILEKRAIDVINKNPSGIIISPGPKTPNDAGICVELIKLASKRIPVLGICLGHQSIAQAYGGKVVKAKNIMHGLSKKNIIVLENNQNRIIQKYNWEAIDQTLVNLYKKLLV